MPVREEIISLLCSNEVNDDGHERLVGGAREPSSKLMAIAKCVREIATEAISGE